MRVGLTRSSLSSSSIGEKNGSFPLLGIRKLPSNTNKASKRDGHVFLIDLYSEGTILSNTGTQSANNTRLRFSNIKGETNTWHYVGILPTVDCGGELEPDGTIRLEKSLLLQRFNFLVSKDTIRTSHFGHYFHSKLLFPRIGMNVYDQPQERAEMGLKDHNSFRDCTLCTMPTKIKKVNPSDKCLFDRSKRSRKGPDTQSIVDAQKIYEKSQHIDRLATPKETNTNEDDVILSIQLNR